MMLVDSHCHLDGEAFEADRDAVVARAQEAGVVRMLAIGTGNGPPDLETGIRLAERYDCILATCGVHPHDASKWREDTAARVSELSKHAKVVAIGEIGLDYHYDFSPREQQREAFVRQMWLAREASLPIVIHTREAWSDTIDLLREHWRPAALPGIMHCFSGDIGQAREALDLGFSISFGGMVTFPKAHDLQQTARYVPSVSLLVETDAPYLAPVPHRGKRNEPAFVVQTARFLAALRGVSSDEIAAQTTANFERLCLPRPEANG